MRPCVLLLLASTLMAREAPDLSTRAETTNYRETSSYDDVIRVVSGLAASSRLVKLESFGTTEEGRSLPLLIISEPSVGTPEGARRTGRPIVFIMANIHGGEVEGKEAALILARRLVSGDLRPLLRQLVVLIAPIYNADGNEKVSVQNRGTQNGPIEGVGTRENTKGLDLNRDYMKLESQEARALAGLLTRWDPHVTIDLHTTNGSYHGYHLMYAPTLNPNADARLIGLARERLLPSVRGTLLKRHGFRSYYYGNFADEGGRREVARVDPDNPGDVSWRTFDHRPRFGSNYIGLRNRVAILSEAYSYLDFQSRVKATEAFVEELLRVLITNATRLTTLLLQLDGEMKAFGRGTMAKGRGRRPRSRVVAPQMGVDFAIAPLPDPVEILIGDVERREDARSGDEMLAMTDAAVPVRMREYGLFTATRTLAMPRGWLIPGPHVEAGRYGAALDRLRRHGLVVQRVTAPAEVDVERFLITNVTRAERLFEGHHEIRLTGRHEAAVLSAQAGALFVPAAQPLGRLAFYLLEAESDDGLVTWNLIEDGLTVGQTYPFYRVMDARGLQLE